MSDLVRVKMYPHLSQLSSGEGGVHTVIRNYFQFLPEHGVELVPLDSQDYDVLAIHAGTSTNVNTDKPIVSHLHGMYWEDDKRNVQSWEHRANAGIVKVLRHSEAVTVPSEWVARSIRREMRIDPAIIRHGINLDEWGPSDEVGDYVLSYSKNRGMSDVCNPKEATALAAIRPDIKFLATFSSQALPNIRATGVVSHATMKEMVRHALVYVSSIKETWGIGALEALACGVPVLTADAGHVPSLVGHGETGYCYRPGDLEDMANGLEYCLKYRDILSQNALATASGMTWEQPIRELAALYHSVANRDYSPSVTVVIPVYNKSPQELERAIVSVQTQTIQPQNIVVVDDGSVDGAIYDSVIDGRNRAVRNPEEVEKGEDPIYYPQATIIHQTNRGVAVARNNGIQHMLDTNRTKYVCCLDADDRIEPQFLEACVAALEGDRSLGIAYTRLKWVKPDGATGVSDWPGEWNFDESFKYRNQVPTCCVFRTEMWERTGGYRQRYAPTGAGEEDAELWLRAGVYGFKGQLVTNEPLFEYSFMSGHTSTEDHNPVDWLSWHRSWLGTNAKHPILSYAVPANGHSHSIWQYDSPTVSVVIPCHYNHIEHLYDALDSLEAQTFHSWEVTVVVNGYRGSEYDPRRNPETVVKAYPYVRWQFYEDAISAGTARNIGAASSTAPYLLFLDADDYLYPTFMQMTYSIARQVDNTGIYTAYMGRAIIDDVSELDASLRRNIVSTRGNEYTMRYPASDFDCTKALRQPRQGESPYIWCNITTLIPAWWHDEIGGFDEDMLSWEDVDYWWRLAKAGHCFQRIPEPLMLYRFYTGTRRNTGWEMRQELYQYLKDKHSGIEVVDMGCKCQDDKKSAGQTMTSPNNSRIFDNGVIEQMDDENLVLVRYLHGNKGQHVVRGASGDRRNYGYRRGGEQFLVLKSDIEAQPHMFMPIQQKVVNPAQQVKRPAPEPPTQNVQSKPVVISRPTLTQNPPQGDIWAQAEAEVRAAQAETAEPEVEFNLTDVKGIGPAISEKLVGYGLDSPDTILRFSDLPDGIHPSTWENLRRYAQDFV